MLAALYTNTCYRGPGYVLERGLAEDVHKDVAEGVDDSVAKNVHKDVDDANDEAFDEAVDDVVAGVGGSHPEETCGGLLGPAQTAGPRLQG